MTSRGNCEICGSPVQTAQTAAYPITGYEIERGQGGANAIRLRERIPNRIAHAACVNQKVARQRQGISEGQMTL